MAFIFGGSISTRRLLQSLWYISSMGMLIVPFWWFHRYYNIAFLSSDHTLFSRSSRNWEYLWLQYQKQRYLTKNRSFPHSDSVEKTIFSFVIFKQENDIIFVLSQADCRSCLCLVKAFDYVGTIGGTTQQTKDCKINHHTCTRRQYANTKLGTIDWTQRRTLKKRLYGSSRQDQKVGG